MEDADRAEVLLAQPRGERFGDRDGPVIAAGAADRDREPGLPLAHVGGDGDGQVALQDVEELARDRLAQHVVADGLGQSGIRAQVGDVVRVLHEPDVEDEVGLERHPELVAEADDLDRELVRSRGRRNLGEQPLPELAQREVGGVDDDVRLRADGLEHRALALDRAADAPSVAERVPVARLGEAADEDVVASLEEDEAGRDAAALQGAPNSREGQSRVTRPDIEDDRHLGEAHPVRGHELGEFGQELARQVVDDEVAEVLEELRRRGLATARQAAEDDDGLFRSALRGGRCRRGVHGPLIRGLGHRPERRMNQTVISNRTYIVPPSTNGLTRSPPGVATAAKIAIPRITIRRDALRRAEDRMPTRDRPMSRIGNSMINPNARNIVVTKSKYDPAVMSGWRSSEVK